MIEVTLGLSKHSLIKPPTNHKTQIEKQIFFYGYVGLEEINDEKEKYQFRWIPLTLEFDFTNHYY